MRPARPRMHVHGGSAPAVPAAVSGRVRRLHPGWFASVMATVRVVVVTS